MMQFPNGLRDIVRLRFIPFSLKDLVKKWMHSFPKKLQLME